MLALYRDYDQLEFHAFHIPVWFVYHQGNATRNSAFFLQGESLQQSVQQLFVFWLVKISYL
jgi:hypothetical protein